MKVCWVSCRVSRNMGLTAASAASPQTLDPDRSIVIGSVAVETIKLLLLQRTGRALCEPTIPFELQIIILQVKGM